MFYFVFLAAAVVSLPILIWKFPQDLNKERPSAMLVFSFIIAATTTPVSISAPAISAHHIHMVDKLQRELSIYEEHNKNGSLDEKIVENKILLAEQESIVEACENSTWSGANIFLRKFPITIEWPNKEE